MLAWLLVCAGAARSAEPRADELTFERHIWPILKAHCLDCHGALADDLKGQLDLRQKRRMEAGGESGAALVPGDAEASLLWQRVRDGEMPPGDHRMPDDQQQVLRAWIDAGARTARPEPEQIPPGLAIMDEERSFWAFQPVRRVATPRRDSSQRARTPIDSLLLGPLQDAGLGFSDDAEPAVLLRRLYLDLLGVPPTPEEVRAFEQDARPDAYERMVDRVLASPGYGERWGRHWLDLAGYAESEGVTTVDADRPFAWRYRDYVIRSWNADKPHDQFLAEQLAGDEMVSQPFRELDAGEIEKLEATGFLRMAPDGTGSGADGEEGRNQTIADTVKMLSTSLLGLTIGCAQCHDHRYDPISQADYYRLRAVFEPALDPKNWRTPDQRLVSLASDEDRALAAAIEAEVTQVAEQRAAKQREFIDAALAVELARYPEPQRAELEKAYRTPADQREEAQRQLLARNPSVNIDGGNLYQYNAKAAEELKAFETRMAELRARKPAESFVRALTEIPGQVPRTFLFHRGDYREPRDAIEPGPPTILASSDTASDTMPVAAQGSASDTSNPGNTSSTGPAAFDPVTTVGGTSGRRLAMARWLARPDHPLTSRVLANQLWLHHFGRGLVDTPGDFGRLGQPPSHPELLDWLASELVRGGWSIKHVQRWIVTSTVYRQSSQASPRHLAADRSNRWYGKWPVQRLDAEVVRDRMLAVAGQLSLQMFGPSVAVSPDPTGQVAVTGDDRRRSVYLRVQRTQPVTLLSTFDAPLMVTNCERRTNATSPDQALMLMNGDFVLRQAGLLADRVEQRAAEAHGTPDAKTAATITPDARIEAAWWIVYGRVPQPPEMDWARAQWTEAAAVPDNATDEQRTGAARQALVDLCQVLLGSNEFLYVD